MHLLIEFYERPDCKPCIPTKRMIDDTLKEKGYKPEEGARTNESRVYRNGRDAIKLDVFDVDSVDGMAQAAFREVHSLPTTIVREDERDVARWSGVTPKADDFEFALM